MSELSLNRILALLSTLIVGAVACANSLAQEEDLFYGLQRQDVDSIFLVAPREITRPLLNVKKRIDRGKWDEAVATLGEILNDPNVEDYLITSKSGVASSLLQRTQKILGSIPTEHRESYRVRYGTRARKLLEQAIAENDLASLQDITRRYFYTQAGYDAAMLVGHLFLGEGKPVAAASFFSRIVETEEARELYDPEASVLLAMSWMLADDPERAKAALLNLKAVRPAGAVKVLGREVDLFADDDDALSWLQELIGTSSLSQNRFVNQWLMFQGNAARTGQSGAGFPLISPKWSQPTMMDPRDEATVKELLQLMIDDGISPAPSVQPLIVGDTVVMRSNEQLLGVDFETGKRLWVYPPQSKLKLDFDDDREQYNLQAFDEKARIRQRLWQDTVYGQAASDGERVFLVPDPELALSTLARRQLQTRPTKLREFNELVAVNVAREGALAWQVGGATGLGEPRLAGTMFLGAPLCYEGQLYCICQQEGLIKLVVLDPISGKLSWSQQLANNERRVDFMKDPYRRLAGATPSCSNGLLICPTGIGALVAIDLSTRSLKWGYNYSKGRRVNPANAKRGAKTAAGLEGLWRDFSVVISDGRVLYTPVELQEMLSIDLYSGEPKKRIDRAESMYVAGVDGGRIVLVGANSVRAIDNSSNEEVWEVNIGEYGVPTGRGYIGDGALFLPMSKSCVLKVDLTQKDAEKKPALSVSPARMILGNLVRYRGDVVSQGVDVVATFPQDEATRKVVEGNASSDDIVGRAMPDHQVDFLRVQLLIQDGDLPTAVATLAKAYDENPVVRYEKLLCKMIVDLIEVDFKAGSQYAEKYDAVLMRHQAESYLVAKVYGLIANQENRRGIQLLTNYVESRTSGGQLVSEGEGFEDRWVTVKASLIDSVPFRSEESRANREEFPAKDTVIRFRVDRWLAVQLGILFDQAVAAEPEKAGEFSRLITDSILKFKSGDALAKYAHYRLFPLRAIRPDVRLSLAKELQSRKFFLRANHLFASVIERPTFGKQAALSQALVGQAAMMVEAGDADFAKSILDRLDKLSSSSDGGVADDVMEASAELRTKMAQNDMGPLFKIRDRFIYENDETRQGPLAFVDDFQWDPKVVEAVEDFGESDQDGMRVGEFLFADHVRYRNLVCQFDHARARLRISDCLGRNYAEYFLQPDRRVLSEARNSPLRLWVRNHLMMINQGENVYVLNWFNLLQGKKPLLWHGKTRESVRIGVSYVGMRSICVVDENKIRGLDWLTGEMVWERNNMPGRGTWISNDRQIGYMRGRFINVLDVDSGRCANVVNLDDELGMLMSDVGNLGLYRSRVGKVSAPDDSDEVQKSDVVDDPFAATFSKEVYQSFQFTVVNMLTGRPVFQKQFSSEVRDRVFEDKFAVAGPDGVLKMFELSTGELLFETKVADGIPEGYSLRTLEVDRFQDDYLVRLNLRSKDRRDGLELNGSRYHFRRVKSSLAQGPVMLIDGQTGARLWQTPASIENFGLIKGQPKSGPAILFCRRIKRNAPDERTDVQVIAIDRKTGKLLDSFVFYFVKNGASAEESYVKVSLSPGSILGTGADNQKQVMQIDYQERRFTLTFGEDDESPPQPTTFVTNENSIEFPKLQPVVEVELTTEDADRRAFEAKAANAAEALQRLRDEEAKLLETQMDLKPRLRENDPPKDQSQDSGQTQGR